MPTFETVIIFKKLSQEALRAALKRNAGYVFEVGCTLRKMENLGLRNLPYKIKSQGRTNKMGHFFIFTYDSGLDKPLILRDKFQLDFDVIRSQFWLRYRNPIEMHSEKEKPECTLHEDLLPPPYRPAVIELQQIAEEKLLRKKKKSLQKNFEDTDFLIY